MASTYDGFMKLSESGSRRSSFHHQSQSGYGSQGQDEGCLSRCFKSKVTIRREDGNLVIGGISLSTNCHAIMVTFGFFFMFAGVVLTIISYKTPVNVLIEDNSSTREEGKIAGPIFIVVGSLLFVIGFFLSLINWKLRREAKIQRSRFSLGGISNLQTPDAQSEIIYAKGRTPRTSCSFPSSRRESFFPVNYFAGRRRTLPTISQAVPFGLLVDGKVSALGRNSTSGFFSGTPTEKNEETETPERVSSCSSRRKASLSLRASLPIPLLGSPNFMKVRSMASDECVTTRSDEPYGSIVSLSGTGDIACFPAHSTRFPPCKEEPASRFPFFENETRPLSQEWQNANNRELPVITVNDCVNPVQTKQKGDRSVTVASPLPHYRSHHQPNDSLEEELLENPEERIHKRL